MAVQLFGYTHINWPGLPKCPCNDPGNYMCGEQPGDDPMEIKVTCWCGRHNTGTFDSVEERAEFLSHISTLTQNAKHLLFKET